MKKVGSQSLQDFKLQSDLIRFACEQQQLGGGGFQVDRLDTMRPDSSCYHS